jgi:hypothetical protein
VTRIRRGRRGGAQIASRLKARACQAAKDQALVAASLGETVDDLAFASATDQHAPADTIVAIELPGITASAWADRYLSSPPRPSPGSSS